MKFFSRVYCSADVDSLDVPRDKFDKDLTIDQEKIHMIARTMKETDVPEMIALANEVEKNPKWSLIHGDSGPPNNRTSFADLFENRRILATFAPYDALDSIDDGNLVLHVDILDEFESPQELYELE
ncbi:uncharacterized protein J4E92_003516 [Alternaria infectoria]|uniref:uncharacterized protein n=1 Tax=Alternaria infectoria TaxID=45303 RepID=UPI002220B7DE|nr:uncharacterized protein J4E92_003516 [Alternaria infectoria]KAI4933847.1 hypothetical protein J4E92_003516 [Alternaria infectoria]